jgi:hypothetical protein
MVGMLAQQILGILASQIKTEWIFLGDKPFLLAHLK